MTDEKVIRVLKHLLTRDDFEYGATKIALVTAIDKIEELHRRTDGVVPIRDEYFYNTYLCGCCGRVLAESVDDECCLEEEMAKWCAGCGTAINWKDLKSQ